MGNLYFNNFNKTQMPGTLGKFRILRTLGSGASCKVKLAQNTETGSKVAVKIMKSNLDDREQ